MNSLCKKYSVIYTKSALCLYLSARQVELCSDLLLELKLIADASQKSSPSQSMKLNWFHTFALSRIRMVLFVET